ncbi:VWA domain-containing protein [uncultured Paludibaculum sp.]|uniref:VWA domain-containing protein n=1 Tax=uncultured Paludibaculum sp. TaxID=1765020 RepID=UPI002AAB3676|nr:VWA domain-containing protein [uncultured Paludibaculum sp.]
MTTRRSFLSLASCLPALGQQLPVDSNQTITYDVTRVNMLFTVADKRGRFVNNLTKDDFEVFEDKRRQKTLEFAAETNLPLRIGLLIDTSNSIRDRFRFEMEASGQFLKSVVRKNVDKAVIYSFDTETRVVQDFSDDTDLLDKKVKELRPGGGTAFYDSIFLCCRDRLDKEQPRQKFRRALILVGDGEDNNSHYTRDQALEQALKTEAVVFSISTNTTRSETDGDKVLRYFARETGGLPFFPFKAEDLAQDFENIANELRSQYSILFRPEPLKQDGLYHSVQVKVKSRKDLVVRARRGYYADKQ